MAGNFPIDVIGASAGGVEAVSQIVRGLPADFPGAIFIAMHFPVHSTSVLPRILARAGKLPAIHPEHGADIEAGHIYVAPPDRHLVVLRNTMHLVRGPRENGNRPAIDPMFRSAAVAHRNRVVAVVLTGNLDDGTSGLLAVKRRGGVAIAQDPADALFPSMPASAVEHVPLDFVLPLAAIPEMLSTIVARIAAQPLQSWEETMDDDAVRETSYTELDLATVETPEVHPGRPSEFGCPDCGGVLWEIQDGELQRYRCRVGHAWTADALLTSQADQLDQALWTALRALEENAALTDNMAQRARSRGNDLLAAKFERDARTARHRAHVIQQALLAGIPAAAEPSGGADKFEAKKTGS